MVINEALEREGKLPSSKAREGLYRIFDQGGSVHLASSRLRTSGLTDVQKRWLKSNRADVVLLLSDEAIMELMCEAIKSFPEGKRRVKDEEALLTAQELFDGEDNGRARHLIEQVIRRMK